MHASRRQIFGADNVSLLTKASTDDQQGRYYHKTLDEIDNISLVRDRGGATSTQNGSPGLEEEEEEEEAEMAADDIEQYNAPTDARDTESPAGPQKTDRQQAMEAEWGLYRSPVLSQKSDEDEDPETDDDRKHNSPDVDDEEFMVRCACRSHGVIWRRLTVLGR